VDLTQTEPRPEIAHILDGIYCQSNTYLTTRRIFNRSSGS
jgi:hypothetical protein